MLVQVEVMCAGREKDEPLWVDSADLPAGPPDTRLPASEYKQAIPCFVDLGARVQSYAMVGAWTDKPGHLVCDRIEYVGR